MFDENEHKSDDHDHNQCIEDSIKTKNKMVEFMNVGEKTIAMVPDWVVCAMRETFGIEQEHFTTDDIILSLIYIGLKEQFVGKSDMPPFIGNMLIQFLRDKYSQKV